MVCGGSSENAIDDGRKLREFWAGAGAFLPEKWGTILLYSWRKRRGYDKFAYLARSVLGKLKGDFGIVNKKHGEEIV